MKLTILALLCSLTFAITATASKAPPITEAEIRAELSNLGLTDTQTESILKALKDHSRTPKLNVSSLIFSGGFDYGLFRDHINKRVTVGFHDESGAYIKSNKLVEMDYWNSGVAINFGYKWVLMFVMDGLDMNTIDGATFGRGFGVTLNPGVGVDLQYLPGDNRAGSLLVVAPQIGLAAGLRFPKVTFSRIPVR